MVLDAGAHEALAVLADEQSALRRVATLVAAGPEPDAVFTAVAEEAGRLLHARSAATIRYEGRFALTVGRWTDDDLGGFEVGTAVPLDDSDGLTAIVARTGAPARIEDYRGRARAGGGVDARARLPLGRRRAGRGGRAHRGGSCWSPPRARWARTPSTGSPGSPSCVALALESARRARAAQRVARPHPRGRRDRAPPPGAQPARRRAAAAGLARRPAAHARAAPRRPRDGAAAAARRGARSSSTRSRSCASWPAACTPPCSPTAASRRRWRRSPSRAPLPVSVEGVPEERLAEPLEAAVYFVVAESLTNAVKHAGASELRVRMAATHGELRVEIADDGRGGADPARRHRPARPGRPRRGARRPPRAGVAARLGHGRARRAPWPRLADRALTLRGCVSPGVRHAQRILVDPPDRPSTAPGGEQPLATPGSEARRPLSGHQKIGGRPDRDRARAPRTISRAG